MQQIFTATASVVKLKSRRLSGQGPRPVLKLYSFIILATTWSEASMLIGNFLGGAEHQILSYGHGEDGLGSERSEDEVWVFDQNKEGKWFQL